MFILGKSFLASMALVTALSGIMMNQPAATKENADTLTANLVTDAEQLLENPTATDEENENPLSDISIPQNAEESAEEIQKMVESIDSEKVIKEAKNIFAKADNRQAYAENHPIALYESGDATMDSLNRNNPIVKIDANHQAVVVMPYGADCGETGDGSLTDQLSTFILDMGVGGLKLACKAINNSGIMG